MNIGPAVLGILLNMLLINNFPNTTAYQSLFRSISWKEGEVFSLFGLNSCLYDQNYWAQKEMLMECVDDGSVTRESDLGIKSFPTSFLRVPRCQSMLRCWNCWPRVIFFQKWVPIDQCLYLLLIVIPSIGTTARSALKDRPVGLFAGEAPETTWLTQSPWCHLPFSLLLCCYH